MIMIKLQMVPADCYGDFRPSYSPSLIYTLCMVVDYTVVFWLNFYDGMVKIACFWNIGFDGLDYDACNWD